MGVAVCVAVGLAVGGKVKVGLAVGAGGAVSIGLGNSVGTDVCVGGLVALGRGVALGWLSALHALRSIAMIEITARRLLTLKIMANTEVFYAILAVVRP